MNSGGAHCLKYGVTTNNLLGVTMVLMDGTVVELGGAHLDAPGLDLLGVVCGSEGQLGVVTEATLRILRKPEGARPVLMGFASNEVAGACVSDIIRAGVLPVAIEFMDRPCIRACEAFAHAGYPDVEALLIVEVEGAEAEIAEQLDKIIAIAERHAPEVIRPSRSAEEVGADLEGPQGRLRRDGPDRRLHLPRRHHPGQRAPLRPPPHRRAHRRATASRVANVFHAGDGNMHPLILYDASKPGELAKAEALGADILRLCVEVGGCLTGEHGVGVEKRDLMAVPVRPRRPRGPAPRQGRLRPEWLLNPAKVFPLAASASRRRAA